MYKLMKRIYLLLSLLLCSLLCMSQVSTSQNYISTRTYTSPDHSGCREQVVYFDGLGRPSQTVDCHFPPTWQEARCVTCVPDHHTLVMRQDLSRRA